MSLNDHQKDYMRSLAAMPREDVCGCGWYPTSECRHICPTKSPSQRPDDKLYMEAYQEGRKDARDRARRLIDSSISDHIGYAKTAKPELQEYHRSAILVLQAIRDKINDSGYV